MRAVLVVQITAVIAFLGFLSGCSSYPPAYTGGTYDTSYSESHPEPVASPSLRPGLNPEDPRNPQFNSRPEPDQTPPTSKP